MTSCARGIGLLLALLALAAPAARAAAPFVDNGDGTVTDTSTGLMWDQCTLDRGGATCATGAGTTYTWAAALAAAATQNTANFKGYSDWRLPSFVELLSLVKSGGALPAIDSAAFPNTAGWFYWSGSTHAATPANAWDIDFFNGNANPGDKTNSLLVRLVRSGQSSGTFAQGSISGVTASTATLSASSPVAATGHWLAVPRDATAPTHAQVIAGVDYGGVVVTAGSGAMAARTPASFSLAGLAAGTAYDLYLVATETITGFTAQLVGPIQFSTTAITTRSIVIDPTTPTTLHAAVESQGIYRSFDSGANWNAATTQPANTNLRALVIQPGNSARLYAATYGGGVFKSIDSGANWSTCAGQPANLNLVSLAIDAAGRLYAGSEGGVFASSDSCATWTAMNTGLPN